MTEDEALRLLGEINRETLADWFRRFAREREINPLSDEEVNILIKLGQEDEKSAHQ